MNTVLARGIVPLAAGLLLSQVVRADEPRPFQPTQSERATLEDLTCKKHGVGVDRIEGWVYGKGAMAAMNAEVHCMSQTQLRGQPTHIVIPCAKSNAQWRCEGQWTAILVPVELKQVEVRTEGDIPLAQAYDVVSKIGQSGEFQSYKLDEALAPPCYVYRGKEEFIDVKCQGWHITATQWCPQGGQCPRIISINKLSEPAALDRP